MRSNEPKHRPPGAVSHPGTPGPIEAPGLQGMSAVGSGHPQADLQIAY
jgi:hypothetical protein